MVKVAKSLAERGLLDPVMSRYVPHQPHAKQAAFLSPIVNARREVLYGGAAGGGKTDALLMAALQYVDVPGYSGVLVRQTYPMLDQPGGIIPRSKEWLAPTDAIWNQQRHEWSFPSGATIVFRHLADEQAVRDYQGGEYDFIGVDELTDFAEQQYRFLFSRQRRLVAGPDVPLRMRATANPIGPGKRWVRQRFLVEGLAAGRLFIPARLEDNPALDQESYDLSLRELGSVRYAQLRHGDWEVEEEGRTFRREWFDAVKPKIVPANCRRVRFWDLAATETPKGTAARRMGDPDWTAGLLLARATSGTYYVEDVRRARVSAAKVEALILQTAEADGKAVPIRMEQEGGASGVSLISHYRRHVLDGYDFRGIPSTGSKEVRAAPVAARAEQGEVALVEGRWNREFLDELAEFPDGVHDDQVDALSGAFGWLAGRQRGKGRGVSPQGLGGTSHWRE